MTDEYRAFRYKTGEEPRIFEGREAVKAAEADGWVDTPAKLVDEPETLVDAADDLMGDDEEPDKLICPKCGKEYEDESWYRKHLAKCEG